MPTAELEHQILELEPRERARLVRILLDSLEELSELEIEELWLDEAESRNRTVESGKAGLFPADEVMKEARARRA
jgi:putative addiction module component (TIGR02574 family)